MTVWQRPVLLICLLQPPPSGGGFIPKGTKGRKNTLQVCGSAVSWHRKMRFSLYVSAWPHKFHLRAIWRRYCRHWISVTLSENRVVVVTPYQTLCFKVNVLMLLADAHRNAGVCVAGCLIWESMLSQGLEHNVLNIKIPSWSRRHDRKSMHLWKVKVPHVLTNCM